MAFLIQYMPLGAGSVAMTVAASLMVRRLKKGKLGGFALFEAVFLPALLLATAAAFYWSGAVLATPVDISRTGLMMLGFLTTLSAFILFLVLLPLFLILFALGALGLPWTDLAQCAFMIIIGGMLGNVLGFVYATLRKPM